MVFLMTTGPWVTMLFTLSPPTRFLFAAGTLEASRDWEGCTRGAEALFAGRSVETVEGFVTGADCNLHLDIIRGRSDHHKIEAVFKAAAKALKEAVLIEERVSEQIPSTKGII